MTNQEKYNPPRWPLSVLRWVIRPQFMEEIEGDMEETFLDDVERLGVRKARWYYAWNVMLLFRPALLRNFFRLQIPNPADMLANYLKTGWRNFKKYRTYSSINIFGLALGFTASLLLFLIINYENSFDRFHRDVENIYRVASQWSGGDISDMIVTPQVPLMVEEYTDIVAGTRFHGSEDMIAYDEKFVRSEFRIVDSTFASVFSFAEIQGSVSDALSSPGQIVLTESLAKNIFGSDDAMGKTLSLVNQDMDFIVRAVVEDPPQNSTIQFQALIPWSSAPEWLDIDQSGNWYNMFMTGYVRVTPGTDKAGLENHLDEFGQKYFLEDRKGKESIVLLPLIDEHFRISGNRRLLTILGIIAVAILLISCINFMNLSISQLLERTREIGVRKVMGGRPWQLISQFMTEGLIICTLAVIAGMATTYLLIPIVQQYFDFAIDINSMTSLSTTLFILAVCFGAAVMSSLWPAFVLSGLQSTRLLHGRFSWNKTGGFFRKGLIVLQYAASILLIIGTLVVWKQIQYMKTQDLNFDGSYVVGMEFFTELFKDPALAEKKMQTMKEELMREPAILSVSATNSVPGKYWHNYNSFSTPDSIEPREFSLRQLTVDDRFFETFEMEVIEGRDFDKDLDGDGSVAILNEAAVEKYGWTDLEDKFLRSGGGGELTRVIGVVKDYHYQSLSESIQPVIHFYHPEAGGQLAVRLHPENIQEGLKVLETKWNELDPFESFSYFFVDEEFDQLYKEHEKLGLTSTVFCMIAILLAGMGLFSLSAYSIRLRKKEIGVRKVLGASISSIIYSLSRGFSLLVVLAFLITCPVIYLLLNRFLDDFAFRISLSPWIFLMGGVFVFLVSIFIVGYQSARAATESPVYALKDE